MAGRVAAGGPGRIPRLAAGELEPGQAVRAVPIGAPVPDIAAHIVQAVAIRRESGHRRGAGVAVRAGVLDREGAGPGIGAEFPVGLEVIPPGEALVREPATGGVLPFGFGRQALAGPLRVGGGVFPGDHHDRVIVAAFQIAGGAFRVLPIRAQGPGPPVLLRPGADRAGPRREGDPAGLEVLRWRLGGARRQLLLQLVPIDRALGDGLVAGGRGELAVVGVGHVAGIHPEGIQRHFDQRFLIRRGAGERAAHGESPAGDQDHARRFLRPGGGKVDERSGENAALQESLHGSFRGWGFREPRPALPRGR